jgi:hypothetical protein
MQPHSGLVSLENGFADPMHVPADSPSETMSVGTQPAARPSGAGAPGSIGDQHQGQSIFERRREFVHFVVKAQVHGHSLTHGHEGPYQPKPYVPLTKLREYWTPRRISEVLSRTVNLPLNPQVIKDRYLRVFSTLMYINEVVWLQEFTETCLDDQTFPSDPIPSRWQAHPPVVYKEFWEKFSDTQWMFFPCTFDPNQLLNSRIPTRCILPLDKVTLLVRGGAAEVHKIRIREGYNELSKVGS